VKAFTIIELLVTVSIIGLLVGLGVPALNSSLNYGKKAKEIAALKSLIASYNFYSADNNNKLLKSYDLNGAAYDINGNPIGGEDSHEAHRWPWRLAPYFNYNFYGVSHVNEVESYIKSQGGLTQTYLVSVIPSFGLSINCGGNDYEARKSNTLIASNINHVAKPSQFIAFVSSRSMAAGYKYEGFYYVEHPKSLAKYDHKSNPKSTGYISARYNSQAVVAFLGGNVSFIPYKDLATNKAYWLPEG
jgi:prepilin-type N-terminal cleavage/methylation domain-containing protein